MAPRATASGTISFGLVSVPVKFFTATRSKSLSFNLLHAKDKSRVHQQYLCNTCGEPVERNEMAKGFEYAKEQYVVLTDDELKALEQQSDQSIEIEEFVPIAQVDPVYFEKSYLLGPDKGGQKAYRLLCDAMHKAGRGAVAKWSTRGKQQLVLLREAQGGLMLHGLFYADEVSDFAEIDRGEGAAVKAGELDLAVQLIEQLASKDFEPAKYEDEYRKKTLELIENKVAGQELVVAPSAAPRAQIIDLMEALKASIESKGRPDEEEGERREAATGACQGRRPAATKDCPSEVKTRTREARARVGRAPTLFDAPASPVFFTSDVARLLGVSVRRVRDLARADLCRPGRRGRRYLFTFQDIILLRAAHGLIGQRVPTRKVRQALGHLRRQIDPTRPLSAVRIFADGRQVIVRDGRTAWEPDTGQMMLQFDVGELARAAGVVVPVTARHSASSSRSKKKRQSATVLFERALHLEDDNPKAARETYQLAIQLDPNMSDAYVNLGRLLHENGEIPEAMALYRHALRQNPGDPVAHYNLALALEDQGDSRAATTQYRKALESDPDFADAHFNLGRLLEKLGQRKQAIEHLIAYKQLTEP